MSASETRAGIVAAADELFYRQGYAHTSFADIATAVDLSRGNFYYHFRSKDEILAAVIATRLKRTEMMLADWEKAAVDPLVRIRCFIDIVIRNRAEIKRFGCPVGSLTTELAKLGQQGGGEARRIFDLFRCWLARQFAALGLAASAADAAALHLLAWSQGVAVLANVFHDEAFIRREVREIEARLQSMLPPGRRTGRRARRNPGRP
ncbi:TetR family transcriptional regulator [Dongia mobilis]|uniref:TetR family transcriptional regulator n=1 Tax=Dongia mobilis TaxID=578943 RepID=A0A4R6WUY2_9PROT|nr:TetR/AcrR family transcriptional regulator [Dongia mobilis]TDQ83096.1 TetR family transcriptional regulator [Dongia mobilis]